MNAIDRKLRSLLHEEGLDDFNRYYADYDDSETLPLFSRWRRIAFLDPFPFDRKNRILLKTAIGLLEAIILKSRIRLPDDVEDYLACIALDFDDTIKYANCFYPYIFVTRRRAWILEHLNPGINRGKNESLVRRYLNEMSLRKYEAFSASGSRSESGPGPGKNPAQADDERIYVMRRYPPP